MAKRVRDDTNNKFPAILDIAGLGSMIVHFLQLGQWSDWIWKSKNDATLLRKLLHLRPHIDSYTWNCAVDENDTLLLNLCNFRRDLAIIRDKSNLIADLVFRQKPIVSFLMKGPIPTPIIKEAFYLCCASILDDIESLDWRLQLFMPSMTDKEMECGFLKACLASNVKASKILWSSQRLKTHNFVFAELLMSTSLAMFRFLFGLGLTRDDVVHMRVHFMNNPLILKSIRDTSAFDLLQRAGIIQKRDLQHYFETAFATNNVTCMYYFNEFSIHFQPSVEFRSDRGIWKSECIDMLLRHGNMSATDACRVIGAIRCDIFHRAIDVAKHALTRLVTRKQTKEFFGEVTIIAWRSKNVPLLHWLRNSHSQATAYSFGRCFADYLHDVQNAPMVNFFLTHRPQVSKRKNDEDMTLVRRAIGNKDLDMLRELIHFQVLTDKLILGNWQLQILVYDICLSTIDFLRMIWQHTTYLHTRKLSLIRCAMEIEKADVFQFLTTDMSSSELDNFCISKHLVFFCMHAMLTLIAACKNAVISLANDARLELEYNVYSSLSNTETLSTFRALWKILPMSRPTLAKSQCFLFWKICRQHLEAAIFLWQQQLVSSAELFASPPFESVTHQFLSAIHYDL